MNRVLIVDDEPSICWALSEIVKEEGMVAIAAGSAEEALSQAGDRLPDLILLDVRLPERMESHQCRVCGRSSVRFRSW